MVLDPAVVRQAIKLARELPPGAPYASGIRKSAEKLELRERGHADPVIIIQVAQRSLALYKRGKRQKPKNFTTNNRPYMTGRRGSNRPN